MGSRVVRFPVELNLVKNNSPRFAPPPRPGRGALRFLVAAVVLWAVMMILVFAAVSCHDRNFARAGGIAGIANHIGRSADDSRTYLSQVWRANQRDME